MSNTTVIQLTQLNNDRNSTTTQNSPARVRPNSGGYDCNFIEDPPDELVCQICTLVAQHPYQSTCCGRVYCKRCIDDYRRKHEELTGNRKFNCPNCRRRANTFHDKRGSRNIKCLKVKCANLELGCEWEGELLNLNHHLSECPHSKVQCPNRCSMVVSRGNLETHLKGACPLRHFSCPDCGKSGTHHYITTEHKQQCPEGVVPCPNGCGFVPITRRLEANHCKVCPNQVVPCEYSDVGCKEKMKRKDVALHRAQRLEHHLHLAMEVVRILQRPVATFKMKDYSGLKSSKKWWYSSPFFSNATNGYKFCLGVMPSGNGDGEGTHLSVYVYRMRGENDDLLEWPFRGQVTFELLNQAADCDHITRTVPFDFQVANEYNSRVVKGQGSGERSAQGWGFNRLVSHDHLVTPPPTSTLYSPQPQGGRQGSEGIGPGSGPVAVGPTSPGGVGNAGGQVMYLKDDCLFFRVLNFKVFASNKPWLICSS